MRPYTKNRILSQRIRQKKRRVLPKVNRCGSSTGRNRSFAKNTKNFERFGADAVHCSVFDKKYNITSGRANTKHNTTHNQKYCALEHKWSHESFATTHSPSCVARTYFTRPSRNPQSQKFVRNVETKRKCYTPYHHKEPPAVVDIVRPSCNLTVEQPLPVSVFPGEHVVLTWKISGNKVGRTVCIKNVGIPEFPTANVQYMYGINSCNLTTTVVAPEKIGNYMNFYRVFNGDEKTKERYSISISVVKGTCSSKKEQTVDDWVLM